MKSISINKKKLLPYAIMAVVFYILLGVAYSMRGLDNYPTTSIPSLIIMPLAILFIGIIDFDPKKKWIRVLLTIFLCLYTPIHIINFVICDYKIKFVELFYYNCLIVFGVWALFMTLTLNIRFSTLICCFLSFFIYVINTLVTAFRGTAVTPGDFYAFQTALKVAGEYEYFINIGMVSSIMYTVVLLQLMSKLCISFKGIGLWKNLTARVVCMVAGVVCCAATIKATPTLTFGNVYDAFDTTLSNEKMGTILAFIANVENSKIDIPEGYTTKDAEKLLSDTPTANQEKSPIRKPHIIVIMNEAFSDLTGLYNLDESEDPLKNWHSLKENAITGDMLVSVKGGGTSYTEFEMLTGISGGILPLSKTPYLDCIKGKTHSLAWDLKKEGYTNIAIHPFWSSCWNRGTVYPMLGFDDFISGEDFANKGKSLESYNKITDEHIIEHTDFGDNVEYIRNYISDRESYKKVIEQFENKKNDEKLFVFNVTVQNHSGFEYEGDNFRETITSSKDPSKEMSQYLTLLKESDIAYGELIDYFRAYDEPVVILMFGDHQPGIKYAEYSLCEDLNEKYKKYSNDADYTHRYIVPYKLWTNYDIQEEERGLTCSAYLSLLLKEKAGIGFNNWDSFRMSMQQNFGAVTGAGYMEPDCTKKYSGGNKQKDELIEKYKKLQYYMLFDGGMTNE